MRYGCAAVTAYGMLGGLGMPLDAWFVRRPGQQWLVFVLFCGWFGCSGSWVSAGLQVATMIQSVEVCRSWMW